MILDGKKIKEEIIEDLKIKTKDLNLSLAVIQIGRDEASNIYIKQKEKMCNSLGFKFKHYQFSNEASEEEVKALINKLNQDDTTGILLQLPIPNTFNKIELENEISYLKDVDGLNNQNIAYLYNNLPALVPCTAKGIITLLDYYKIDVNGRHVVLVGRSNLVGKPLINLLLNKNATVTICHSKTINLSKYTKEADILISATGIPNLITEDMVKDGSTIIDVGINRVNDKLCGDVLFEEVKTKTNITPVPGGVGPMTIASLAQNIYEAYLMQNK